MLSSNFTLNGNIHCSCGPFNSIQITNPTLHFHFHICDSLPFSFLRTRHIRKYTSWINSGLSQNSTGQTCERISSEHFSLWSLWQRVAFSPLILDRCIADVALTRHPKILANTQLSRSETERYSVFRLLIEAHLIRANQSILRTLYNTYTLHNTISLWQSKTTPVRPTGLHWGEWRARFIRSDWRWNRKRLFFTLLYGFDGRCCSCENIFTRFRALQIDRDRNGWCEKCSENENVYCSTLFGFCGCVIFLMVRLLKAFFFFYILSSID